MFYCSIWSCSGSFIRFRFQSTYSFCIRFFIQKQQTELTVKHQGLSAVLTLRIRCLKKLDLYSGLLFPLFLNNLWHWFIPSYPHSVMPNENQSQMKTRTIYQPHATIKNLTQQIQTVLHIFARNLVWEAHRFSNSYQNSS